MKDEENSGGLSSIIAVIFFAGVLVFLTIWAVNLSERMDMGEREYSRQQCLKQIEGLEDMGCREYTYEQYQPYNVQDRKDLYARLNADREKDLACYVNGSDVNIFYDLVGDYNLSCGKIEYLNDHFILGDSKRDGGSVSGSYSGFFSYGSVKGQFYDWVNVESVAIGKLPKEVSFHLNCVNSTKRVTGISSDYFDNYVKLIVKDTKNISYYSESDFVMYYTDNCIEVE